MLTPNPNSYPNLVRFISEERKGGQWWKQGGMKGGCVALFAWAQLLLYAHPAKAMQASIERVEPATNGGHRRDKVRKEVGNIKLYDSYPYIHTISCGHTISLDQERWWHRIDITCAFSMQAGAPI